MFNIQKWTFWLKDFENYHITSKHTDTQKYIIRGRSKIQQLLYNSLFIITDTEKVEERTCGCVAYCIMQQVLFRLSHGDWVRWSRNKWLVTAWRLHLMQWSTRCISNAAAVREIQQHASNACRCSCFRRALCCIIGLHRMHEMQAIVTDVRGVCLSVCHAAQLGFTVRGSFSEAFVKSVWPLVIVAC